MRIMNSKFGFSFKRWVVAHNVDLLVSLLVCHFVVIYRNMGIWEYGNMGIWEYENMGIWF